MQRISVNPQAIESAIHQQGLKKWWVAEFSGIHKTTLRRWLSGRGQSARIDNMRRLSDLLKVPLPELCQTFCGRNASNQEPRKVD